MYETRWFLFRKTWVAIEPTNTFCFSWLGTKAALTPKTGSGGTGAHRGHIEMASQHRHLVGKSSIPTLKESKKPPEWVHMGIDWELLWTFGETKLPFIYSLNIILPKIMKPKGSHKLVLVGVVVQRLHSIPANRHHVFQMQLDALMKKMQAHHEPQMKHWAETLVVFRWFASRHGYCLMAPPFQKFRSFHDHVCLSGR